MEAVQDALSSAKRRIGRPGAQVMPRNSTAFTIDAGSWHHATRSGAALALVV